MNKSQPYKDKKPKVNLSQEIQPSIQLENNPQTQPNERPDKQLINKVMNVVCVVLIALGLNDLLFNGLYTSGLINVGAGIVLLPSVMNWDFRTANKYQKVGLIGIALLNVSLIIYLIYLAFTPR
jgi:hypothetical protein